MGFAPGDPVDVKTGGSLGRWVPGGTVVRVDPRCCGQRTEYMVQVGGRNVTVKENQVRRPREVTPARSRDYGRQAAPDGAKVYPPKPKTKRRDRIEIGRGPLRLPAYRAWVKTKPCCFCFTKVVDPHHFGPHGMGQQTDDTRLTPVCRQCHDALHHRRVDELRKPTAYYRYTETSKGRAIDMEHSWAIVEAHVYRVQGDVLAEFLRMHGGQMS